MSCKESPVAASQTPNTTSEFDPTLPQYRPNTSESQPARDATQNASKLLTLFKLPGCQPQWLPRYLPSVPGFPRQDFSFQGQSTFAGVADRKVNSNSIRIPNLNHRVPCITEVRPNLFIGNYAAVKRPAMLEKHRITAIVSIKTTDCPAELGAIPQFTSFVPKGRHLWVKISDQSKSNLLIYLEYICDFIDKMLATPPKLWNDKSNSDESSKPAARGVLIHCQAGISRSATAIVAYLMRKEQVCHTKCTVAGLKRIHPRANPNQGFRSQLEIWKNCGYAGFISGATDHHPLPLVYREYEKKMERAEGKDLIEFTAFMHTHVYTKVITVEASTPARTSPITAVEASAFARTMFACLR